MLDTSTGAVEKQLLEKALEARKKAYAPYSHFLVGAAVKTKDGRIFTGCNVENASYGATICAERTAVVKAVSEGACSITDIAIAGGPEKEGPLRQCSPCGICRQVLSEFADEDGIRVILGDGEHELKVYELSRLMPMLFDF